MPDYTGRITITGAIGTQSYTTSADKESVGLEGVAQTVPVAKVGQLTTRTDNDTGVVTFVTGHGIITSDKVDLFWNLAGVPGSRRNMTATVSGDLVTLDGGSGDNLPANLSAVTGMVPVSYAFSMTGSDLVMLCVRSQGQGWIVFADGSAADISTAIYRFDAAGGFSWASELGTTSPFDSVTVGTVKLSHASSSVAVTMRAEAMKIAS